MECLSSQSLAAQGYKQTAAAISSRSILKLPPRATKLPVVEPIAPWIEQIIVHYGDDALYAKASEQVRKAAEYSPPSLFTRFYEDFLLRKKTAHRHNTPEAKEKQPLADDFWLRLMQSKNCAHKKKMASRRGFEPLLPP